MRIFIKFLIVIFLLSSCSNKDKLAVPPATKQEALIVYQEGIEALMAGQYFIASEKFDQSEALLPQTEWAAKSALMSSYCMYSMRIAKCPMKV